MRVGPVVGQICNPSTKRLKDEGSVCNQLPVRLKNGIAAGWVAGMIAR